MPSRLFSPAAVRRRKPAVERMTNKAGFILVGVLCYGVAMYAGLVPGFGGDAVAAAPEAPAPDSTLRGNTAMRQVLEEEQLYPPEIFSDEDLSNGAIILHIIGVIYMFLALAVVCDEYFVPALEVITDYTGVSDDVAGATFMAAGGSAPELFTSFIGVFIAKSSVGFGTIVGSAVFNVLFVIGMCAVFSKELLELTWWPLFRDSMYYSLSLLVLVVCFWDRSIDWMEALGLFMMYIGYVLLMKYNVALYEKITGDKLADVAPEGDAEGGDTLGELAGSPKGPMGSKKLSRHPSMNASLNLMRVPATFRAGVLHMMLQEVDPLGKGHQTERETRFKRVAHMVRDHIREDRMGGLAAAVQKKTAEAAAADDITKDVPDVQQVTEEDDGLADGNDPLVIEWPKDNWKHQLVFILMFPLMVSFYFTIPDTRADKWRSWFVVSFFMSIMWIGFSSYWMVWWATTIGSVWGIPDPVMGLTFLAAGTSIPDLLSSVIVARQGLGDMAVSSSIGSNIFDVLVGLPLPWFFFTVANGKDIEVGTDGLKFSIVILFAMLVSVIGIIACSHWKMTKKLGAAMFCMYGVFVLLNLLVEYGHITPPF